MTNSNVLNKMSSLFFRKFRKSVDVIVLHGASASGKSTLANILTQILSHGAKVMKLGLDTFFNSVEDASIKPFDYDCPAHIDWEAAHEVLLAIHDFHEYIPRYEYNFETKKSKTLDPIKNIHPDILIIEGIYAMNLFSEECFDISQYSPYNPKDEEFFAKNSHSYPRFAIPNIKLNICYERMKQIRLHRDITQRKKENTEIIAQFDKLVWPATKNRVNHKIFFSDITLIHGTFNESGRKTLLYILSKHFKLTSTYELHGTFPKIELASCSKECAPDKKINGIVLSDL